MLQNFKVTALGRIINTQASYFRIESVSAFGGDESVRVRADGQDLGTYLPGDSLRLPKPATLWEITPLSNTATAWVRLGVGQVDSSRVFGQVEMIDSAKNRVMQDRQFLNTATTGTPVAGQFAQVQIWNGEAAKGVAMSAITITNSTSAGTVEMMGNGAQLVGGTVVLTSSKKFIASGQLQNANVQTVRKIDAATGGVPGIPSGLAGAASYIVSINAGAQQTKMPMQSGPFVLGPGTGLVIAHTVAASMMQVIVEGELFDWQ